MQNLDNLRTLIGGSQPKKPKPTFVPNTQDNPAPTILTTLPQFMKKKKKKPNPNRNWLATPQIPNPKPTLQIFGSTNTVTTRLPGPNNTPGPTGGIGPNTTGLINKAGSIGGSGPNKTTGLINKAGPIGGSGPNKQTGPINTPNQTSATGPNIWPLNNSGQSSQSGPTKPSMPLNTPGQTTESGPNKPSWSINPVGQKSGSGPANPMNTKGQTSGTGPNTPSWSVNTQGKTSGGSNKPSWSINMAQTSGIPGTNNPGPIFQPPQKTQPVFETKPNQKVPLIGDGPKGNTKEIDNWTKFIRDVEDVPKNQNTQNQPFSQNVQSGQIIPQKTESQTQAATTTANQASDMNINFNKAALEKPRKRKPGGFHIPNPYINIPSHSLHQYLPGYPKGIPKSFLTQAHQDNLNVQTNITTSYEMPAWLSNQTNTAPKPPTFAPTQSTEPQAIVANNPIFVQTDTPSDVQQPYSPSDVYDESSFGGNNSRDDHDGSESSEVGQSAQKRLSAFQRLGPLSQSKKPKLTINLMFNKEQAVREVVDATEENTEKYTPVHLRQNIITSTDETVVKYLPSWPWKKRVPLRKSVTLRHSKTVMILEQEQMEEIYEKDNVFMQVTVKGYPKFWNKEDVLDVLLEVAKGKSLIPCFTEFTEEECKFLVLRSRSALVMIHKCGFVVRKDDVELRLVISHTDVTLKQLDFLPRLVLRKRLMLGYDGERKLNLKEFTLKEDISHFMYYPLNRLTNQMELIQLQSTIAWDYLTDLDLSYNRLTSISGFDLASSTPRLKNLNLSHNYIEKVTELLKCRDLTIHSIWLEGNPLCLDYIDSQHYIKVVKMVFTSVKEIDGVPITLRGDLPPIKRNYCPEEAAEFVEKFLEIYFPLLDTMPDDRSCVQNLYADNATMTITYRNKLRHSPVYRCFRNLFLRSRAFEEGETDSVETSSSIVKLINRWPEFEHDPTTFTVDVLYYDDFSAILRVVGIVKLKADTLADDEHSLAFTKTFVLRSRDGVEYKIQNELVYWDHPTEEYAATAFKVTTVKTKQLSLKLDSTPSEDLKDKLLDLFMQLTSLKRKASERCLELKSWNFKDALEHFTKLLKLDSLESLTRDEV